MTVKCPTCGKEFDRRESMRKHHTKVHDEAAPVDVEDILATIDELADNLGRAPTSREWDEWDQKLMKSGCLAQWFEDDDIQTWTDILWVHRGWPTRNGAGPRFREWIYHNPQEVHSDD